MRSFGEREEKNSTKRILEHRKKVSDAISLSVTHCFAWLWTDDRCTILLAKPQCAINEARECGIGWIFFHVGFVEFFFVYFGRFFLFFCFSLLSTFCSLHSWFAHRVYIYALNVECWTHCWTCVYVCVCVVLFWSQPTGRSVFSTLLSYLCVCIVHLAWLFGLHKWNGYNFIFYYWLVCGCSCKQFNNDQFNEFKENRTL